MHVDAVPTACPGAITTHVDGTSSPCTRGRACTRGMHTAVEDCFGVEEHCAYCWTLRCEHDVIEHRNGAEECAEFGGGCPPGSWHVGDLLDCDEVYSPEHACPPEQHLEGTVPFSGERRP